MQIVSYGDNLHEMSNLILGDGGGEISKYHHLSSAELVQKVGFKRNILLFSQEYI